MPPDTIKISQLPSESAPSTSATIPLVQGGVTEQTPLADILALIATGTDGWTSLPYTPNTITDSGNGLYSLLFNGVNLTTTLSAGMRLRTTRAASAPTQATLLNGTTQYYSKSSPTGMTFTDDFVVSGWVKPTAYSAGSSVIASRYNGTSGWQLIYESTGQITLAGYNAGAANNSYVRTYRSIPLNKWTHIAAQLDMSSFTASTTTSYIMIGGMDVPCLVGRGGTSPTALVQAGNLEVGSSNSGTLPFPGKIAQVAIYSAKVTQAVIAPSKNQALVGTETSLISAYSFNNSINDLNANANNLTANGVAVATNADSPFGGQGDGTISSSLDYSEILSATFSTNTTLVVRATDGNTIPTSGGVSAVSYSTQQAPYQCPSVTKRLASVYVGAPQATTTTQDLLGWTMPVTVPTGVTTLEAEVTITFGSITASTQLAINLFDGSTLVRSWFCYTANGTNAFTYRLAGSIEATAGNHTYKLQVQPTGSNITTTSAGAGVMGEFSISKV